MYLRGLGAHRRHLQAAVRLGAANGWEAGLGHPVGEGTWSRWAVGWLGMVFVGSGLTSVRIKKKAGATWSCQAVMNQWNTGEQPREGGRVVVREILWGG